jgi:hypothetical protein
MFYILYTNTLYQSINVNDISQFQSRCQLYIEAFKLQTEDGFMRAETCSCCVLSISYILCTKVVLDCTVYIYKLYSIYIIVTVIFYHMNNLPRGVSKASADPTFF